jgi:hypothetical protein
MPTPDQQRVEESFQLGEHIYNVPYGGSQYIRMLLMEGHLDGPESVSELIDTARAIRRLDRATWTELAHMIEATVYLQLGGLAAAAARFESDTSRMNARLPAMMECEPISAIALRIRAIAEVKITGFTHGPAFHAWWYQSDTYQEAIASRTDPGDAHLG